MARLVRLRIEIEGGRTLTHHEGLTIRQPLYGHHSFSLKVPLEILEGNDEHSFSRSPNELLGKNITFSFDAGDAYTDSDSEQSYAFVFKGIITELSLKNNTDLTSSLQINGYSPTIIMEDGTCRRYFHNLSPADMFRQILNSYPQNLLRSRLGTAATSGSPAMVIRNIVQYDETNFAFICRWAAICNLWIYYNGRELIIGDHDSEAKNFVVDGVQTFDMSMQLRHAKAKYGYYSLGQNNFEEGSSDSYNVPGLDRWGQLALRQSDNIFSNYHRAPAGIYHGTGQDFGLVNAEYYKHTAATEMVQFKGYGEHPDYTVGSLLNVSWQNNATGQNHSYGSYRITDITHQIDSNNNYSNEFSSIPESAVHPPPSPYAVFPKASPELAKVIDNQDPEKKGRVKVQFFWPNDNPSMNESPWIPVAEPYTASGRGMLFTPEVEAIVMVQYRDGNAKIPVVTNSFYHGGGNIEYTFNNNDRKIIGTREGVFITIWDEANDPKIQITHTDRKAGLLMKFAGNGEIILICEQGLIKLHGSNVEIKAERNMTLSADGNINMRANKIQMDANTEIKGKATQINMEADADVDIKGNTSVSVKSMVGLNLEGTANAELKSSGIVTVEGRLIKLN